MDDSDIEFQTIYDAFQSKIQRYLTSLVGITEAEDLAQEVFVKVHRALKNFRGEAKLSTWLYRIATNTALDRLRSPSFRRTAQNCSPDCPLEEGEGELEDRNAWTGESVPRVENQIYRNEMNACIQGFIEKLPDDYRIVLMLSEYQGLSNKEIAEITGITLDTVKIRLHRARERLMEELAANCDSYWIEGNEFLPELRSV